MRLLDLKIYGNTGVVNERYKRPFIMDVSEILSGDKEETLKLNTLPSDLLKYDTGILGRVPVKDSFSFTLVFEYEKETNKKITKRVYTNGTIEKNDDGTIDNESKVFFNNATTVNITLLEDDKISHKIESVVSYLPIDTDKEIVATPAIIFSSMLNKGTERMEYNSKFIAVDKSFTTPIAYLEEINYAIKMSYPKNNFDAIESFIDILSKQKDINYLELALYRKTHNLNYGYTMLGPLTSVFGFNKLEVTENVYPEIVLEENIGPTTEVLIMSELNSYLSYLMCKLLLTKIKLDIITIGTGLFDVKVEILEAHHGVLFGDVHVKELKSKIKKKLLTRLCNIFNLDTLNIECTMDIVNYTTVEIDVGDGVKNFRYDNGNDNLCSGILASDISFDNLYNDYYQLVEHLES